MTIGFFMSGMGLGSYLSRLVKDGLFRVYITTEIALGFVGGLSVPFLYAVFAYSNHFRPLMIGLTIVLGVLSGFEIPLLTRILSKGTKLRLNLSNVLSLDYLGALIATLVFPFVLIPLVGTFRTSAVFGLLNILVGLISYVLFRKEIDGKKGRLLVGYTVFLTALLVLTLYFSSFLLQYWNDTVYSNLSSSAST